MTTWEQISVAPGGFLGKSQLALRVQFDPVAVAAHNQRLEHLLGRPAVLQITYLRTSRYPVLMRGSSSVRMKVVSRGPVPCPWTMVSPLHKAK